MLRRAQAQAVTFTALDTDLVPITGAGFPAGEVKISKDGAAQANVAGAVTELGVGVYTVTLSAAETDAAWLHFSVRHAGMRPVDMSGGTSGHPSGAVVDDAANTATTFETDLPSAVSDFYKGALIVFTTGALQHQVRKVTAYNGATKFLTVSGGFTAEPSEGDRFLVVNI